MDEISLADPELFAVLNDSAGWGRMRTYGLSASSFVQNTFGNTMLQVMLGDFLQLNPVKSHSLLGCFLQDTGIDIPGVPSYEHAEHATKTAKLNQVKHGYDVFDKVAGNVIIFRGAYRFVAGDPLATILDIMRTPGGAKLPEDLLIALAQRIYRPSKWSENRLNPDYVLTDDNGQQVGPVGFFAQGFHSAINWDQVARLQQIWAVQAARLSMGPVAWQNQHQSGSPQRLHWSWPPAACKQVPEAIKAIHAQLEVHFRSRGQLLFYAQAVDVCNVRAYAYRNDLYTQALNVANMSSGTNGLIGVLPWFMGMRIKLTKKIQPPELVQECPAEVIGVRFHPQECFGMPHLASSTQDGMPPSEHECWSTGCVLLDRLPLYLEVRVIGSTTDYTGTSRPGVFFLEPVGDSWTLRYRLSTTVLHPHAIKKRRTQIVPVAMTRYQIPAAPETVGTYQNFQGKTVQGSSGEPCGHTIDMMKPDYMSMNEYKQHVYMILGRAKKLEWTLLKNFPCDEDGEFELDVFETGPPEYIVRNMEELERRDKLTVDRMPDILEVMKCFPKHGDIPKCVKDEATCSFVYDAAAWDAACHGTVATVEAQPHTLKRRLTCKTPESKRRATDQRGAVETQVSEKAATQQRVKRPRLSARAVSHGLRHWGQQRLNLNFEAIEAGGGGDCLFLSIAEGLKELACSKPSFTNTACYSLLDLGSDASAIDLAKTLRRVVGLRVSEKPPEEFLDLMLTWTLTEKAAPDAWYDGWSPSQAMTECGCGFLMNFENIRAVGCVAGDDPDARVFVGRSGSEDVRVRVDNGSVILSDLRRTCLSHLSVMGNHHWGTVTDVVMLSESLNIGFVVMSNTPQQRNPQGARWMFGLNLERADFPYWMMLYNIDLMHFQLLICSKLDMAEERTSVFESADVPLALREHWNLCNERQFGYGSQGGIS